MPEPEKGVASDPKRIGKYDVVERIADGGFAVLYKGYDPFLKRSVAIKVCVSQDAELRQQFLREAEIAGQLDHPNIVRTFDFGFESAGPFLIQEYLEGEDLEHKIKRGDELSLRGKLGLLQEVAEGLAYSHDRGVLHLDIKPANIRLPEAVDGSSSGVKILDFGIARLASSGAEDKLDGMVGTAGYVPPEQISEGEVDARSDVFAFGAVAYELITHRRPFSGATVPELLKQVLEGRSLPLLQTWADCPESVAGLVDRCLESDPASRYQSFEDLLADLRSILAYFPAPEEAEEWVVVAAPEESLAADPSGVEESLPEEQPLISELEDDGDEEAATAQPIEQGGAVEEGGAQDRAPSPDGVVASEPVEGRHGSRSRAVGWLVVAATTVIAVVTLVGRLVPESEEAPTLAERVLTVTSAPSGAGLTSRQGVLVVSAVPWGEVRGVVGANGARVELPSTAVTPLRIVLPPGSYRVEVVGAETDEAWTCDAHIVEGATHICHATLGSVGVTQYWKEMGWWR